MNNQTINREDDMIVRLEEGVFLAEGEGDPPRTLKEENAKEFDTMEDALMALNKARKFRPFKHAEIMQDFL